MASIKIIKEKCVGCKKCVGACPFNAMAVEEKKAVILDNCTLCGACVDACRFEAIDLQKDAVERADISQYEGIWVFCEQFDNQLRTVGLELLGQARGLADQLHTQVTAVLFGEQVAAQAATLIAHGADRVLLVEEPWLKELNDLLYSQVMVDLVHKHKPSILLLGATSFGRSFAPRVASSLWTGLTADCTVLAADVEKGLLQQTRPAFGGNVMATIICPHHRPQMATVRPKVFQPLPADPERQGEVIREKVEKPAGLGMEILNLIKTEGDDVNIGMADVIVSAGKGIGNPKNLALVAELAHLLGGAVGVSRPLVDAGIMGYSHQVGQTGKTVAPKLYIACGISGAIQHVAGIAAEKVVAINNDPDAPIFQYAHYGIVGDCVDVLEALIEEVKAAQKQVS